MAGERNYTVKLKEQGVNFELDFQKVYWCSRLQQERDRLLKLMNSKELLADIFCGVGPLAVRAAKKGLYVIANDLNPFCHEYLTLNCKINKIEDRVICWNMCAREAMRKIYREKDSYSPEFQYPDHIYMNLPVDAIEFLDVLSNYSQEMKTNKMPLVHVNCFVVADTDEKSKELLSIRIKKVLPSFEPEDIIHMHHIKNVTVIMRMYCISIRLRVGAVEGEGEGEENYEKLGKKVKLD